MSSKFSKKGFREGDILEPLPGKTQSNYWSLKDLYEVKVIKIHSELDPMIEVVVERGYTLNRQEYISRSSGRSSDKRESYSFLVNENAFRLAQSNFNRTDAYEIF